MRCLQSPAVPGVWIAVYPVTQALYAEITGVNPSRFQGFSDSPDRPVEQVSWFDAVRFCNLLSAAHGLAPAYAIGAGGWPVVERAAAPGWRLPTVAERDAAAAGGADGWTQADSGGATRPVGQRPDHGGLCDLWGNVWEWCGDRRGIGRALRGGSWFFRADYYATGRQPEPWFLYSERTTLHDVGFRVVRDA